MHGSAAILTLFVQVALILALSRLLGWIFSRFHQPQVIGEMIAGIVLGPSLLGWIAPEVFGRIFPANSLQILGILSQVGVIFFLFLIGLQLDPASLKSAHKSTVAITIASGLCPLILGAALAILFRDRFFNLGRLWSSALFMGVAMSITAFPVLARLLNERNLQRSQVGAITMAAAGITNVAAWCILGIVLATQNLKSAIGAVFFVAVLIFLIRPFLKRLQLIFEQQGKMGQNMLALMIFMLLATAFVTERIGITAFFGAFALGVIMPKNLQFIRQLCGKFEDFVVVFLLPIFFAWIGLSTRITLLNTPSMWAFAVLILLVASVGKIGAAAMAARLYKMRPRDSVAIGVFLNTRGLMTLIILSIGLSFSLISPQIFAMMVLMTLITTGLTTPLLNLIYPARILASTETQRIDGFSILIPIALPKSGGPLVQLADALMQKTREAGRLYALHLRRPSEHEALHPHEEESQSQAALLPLLSQAQARALPVEAISFVSSDVPADIASTAAHRHVNLVLMGYHNPVFGKSMLGGTVHRVLTAAATHVAVFVDRGLRNIDRILVPYLGSAHDTLALELAGRMARNTNARVTVLNVVPPMLGGAAKAAETKRQVEKIFDDRGGNASLTFSVVEDSSPVGVVLHQAQNFDLVIIGVAEEWGLESRLFGWRPEKIARDCPASLLIVRRFSKPQEIPTPSPIQQSNTAANPHVAM